MNMGFPYTMSITKKRHIEKVNLRMHIFLLISPGNSFGEQTCERLYGVRIDVCRPHELCILLENRRVTPMYDLLLHPSQQITYTQKMGATRDCYKYNSSLATLQNEVGHPQMWLGSKKFTWQVISPCII